MGVISWPNDRRPLLIIGASGHGRQVAEAARAAWNAGPGTCGPPSGFLDDDPKLRGKTVGGLPVAGTLDHESLSDVEGALGVGYPETKQHVLRRLPHSPWAWCRIVHPIAEVGERNEIREGVLIQAGVVITTDVTLGAFSTINLSATLSHDVQVGALATVSPGANIGGDVNIGEGAFIGIGASIIQGVTIGAWSVVGAGAVVIDDVEPNTVVAGVPARVISRREEGWQND